MPITWCELYDIRDYITNLQEENERLTKGITFLTNEIIDIKKENEELNRMCELYSKSLYYAELKDYKSRCEKAIEYIKENIKNYWGICDTSYIWHVEVILRGDDNSEQ